MLEKFHQFNRQNDTKIIDEELELEMEEKEDLKETKTSHYKKFSRAEKDEMFNRLKNPGDVFSLPKSLRREGIKHLKREITERYITVAKIQEELFNYIDSKYENGTLDPDELKQYVESTMEENSELLKTSGKEAIRQSLVKFLDAYRKIQKFKDFSQDDLIKQFKRDPHKTFEPQGEFKITFTPYSIDFGFKEKEDFVEFVTNESFGVKADYKNTVGLSWGYGEVDTPLTAQVIPLYEANSIYKHEQQHKKNDISTQHPELKETEMSNFIKEELLAHLSEGSYYLSFYKNLLQYRNWKTYGIHETEDIEEILRQPVEAINKLVSLKLTPEEIIHLLSGHKLSDWLKVATRLTANPKGKTLYNARKTKNNI